MDEEILSSIGSFHAWAMEWGAVLFREGWIETAKLRRETQVEREAREDCSYGYVEHYIYKQISGWAEAYIRKILSEGARFGLEILYDCRESDYSSMGVVLGCFTDPAVGNYYLKMNTNMEGKFDELHVFVYPSLETYTGQLSSDRTLMNTHPRYVRHTVFSRPKFNEYFSTR